MHCSMSVWCEYVAGWAAGVSGLIIGHPLDTIKVRQQALGAVGALNVAKYTFKYEGVFAFYKGLLFPLLSAGVLNSVYFGVYGFSLSLFCNRKDKLSAEENINHMKQNGLAVYLSGCVGGFAQAFITCPVDLIKIKLQTETGHNVKFMNTHEHDYRGSLDCVKRVFKRTGLKGCYKGLTVTLWRDIPSSGLYLLVYEKMLSFFHGGNVHSELKFFSTVISGGTAGILSWACIIPLDVLKSRIQADDTRSPTYSGIYDCFKKSYQNDGWKVFGRGFWVMCLRAFPVNAVSLLSYEFVLCHLCK
ncbi:hypothetical protein J437_LFUL009308 [Ladona fulva]|uniref:Solute carrier family 25 member 45 n=1 Tax=Ladona fulva TaxID=123851 RepID=A0A8K0P0Y7_LADFU|nr:hypothetical protein J437_LFUL009308 [Ladona fulva]